MALDATRQTPMQTARVRELATTWLLSSGIYILNPTDPNHGALYSYFDRGPGAYRLIYAEATGYVLSFLSLLHALTGDRGLLEHARASARWLMRLADRHGGKIVQGVLDGAEVPEAYPFDSGICVKGLLDLFALTGDASLLEAARRSAGWVVTHALNPDGSVKPVFDVRSGEFVEGGIWYRVSGAFQAKIALPLLQLFALTGDEAMRDAASRLCAWALTQQEPNGSFPVNKESRIINLHFHCYAVEALLFAHAALEERKFLDAAHRAAEWMLGVQGRDGGLRAWYGRRLHRERASYALAQTIRIFLLMDLFGAGSHFRAGAERAAEPLARMQADNDDPRLRGGFYAEWGHLPLRPRSLQVTSWATMFAVHALSLLERIDHLDVVQATQELF